MLSLGVPMFVMGDEVRRTQRGNNNAYCHDSDISWFDWKLIKEHADLHRFVSLLCARRGLRDTEHEHQRVSINTMLRNARKAWHGVKLNRPDWGDASHSLALGGELRREALRFHFVLNAFWEPLDFELPRLDHGRWRRWIDTSLDSPNDIVPWEQAPEVSGDSYRVADRSVVMLFASTQGHERNISLDETSDDGGGCTAIRK
jgi:glycogen operon protein